MYSASELLLALLLSFAVVSARPSERRDVIDTDQHCGVWDTVSAGSYELLLDQWGVSGATSGSDCVQLISLDGNKIAWNTTWSWAGDSGIKSFTNIQLHEGVNQQLSAITSIPTKWEWSYNNTDIVGDVAYDLFTSETPGGSNTNEVMIWLANYGSGPISSAYDNSGTPKPVASNLSFGGYTWNLYSGSNGDNNVYSFLSTSGTITSFSADVYEFLKYLTENQGISVSQYLKTAQAGVEATSGSATFTTTEYSLVIN